MRWLPGMNRHLLFRYIAKVFWSEISSVIPDNSVIFNFKCFEFFQIGKLMKNGAMVTYKFFL